MLDIDDDSHQGPEPLVTTPDSFENTPVQTPQIPHVADLTESSSTESGMSVKEVSEVGKPRAKSAETTDDQLTTTEDVSSKRSRTPSSDVSEEKLAPLVVDEPLTAEEAAKILKELNITPEEAQRILREEMTEHETPRVPSPSGSSVSEGPPSESLSGAGKPKSKKRTAAPAEKAPAGEQPKKKGVAPLAKGATPVDVKDSTDVSKSVKPEEQASDKTPKVAAEEVKETKKSGQKPQERTKFHEPSDSITEVPTSEKTPSISKNEPLLPAQSIESKKVSQKDKYSPKELEADGLQEAESQEPETSSRPKSAQGSKIYPEPQKPVEGAKLPDKAPKVPDSPAPSKSPIEVEPVKSASIQDKAPQEPSPRPKSRAGAEVPEPVASDKKETKKIETIGKATAEE